jgi:hypothetical protein
LSQYFVLGDFVSDKRHGKGVLNRVDGSTYNGEWTNNNTNGFGVATNSVDGTIYSGEIFDLFYRTQNTIHKHLLGNWIENKPHGKGVVKKPDGTISEGNWVNGKLIV